MAETQFKKFEIPKSLFQKIYDISGAADKHKGFVLAICDEEGNPFVITDADATITECGLVKCLEKYIDCHPVNEISDDK